MIDSTNIKESRVKKVAHLGSNGSFSSIAARKFFGTSVEFVPCSTFSEIFLHALNPDSISNNYGIIPIENSLAGSIYENYDELSNHNINILGEIYLKIEHHLVAIQEFDESNFSKIKKVYSHFKALEQCKSFFLSYPSFEKSIIDDTSAGAKFIKEQNNQELCCICSEEASNNFNLKIIRRNIEDKPISITRFFIISNVSNQEKYPAIKGIYKYSFEFVIPHVKGSILKILNALYELELNLTKIESRPIQDQPFDYRFFIDFEIDTHTNTNTTEDIIKCFDKNTHKYKFFGKYLKSTL